MGTNTPVTGENATMLSSTPRPGALLWPPAVGTPDLC
jgi:hypothetical protein